jgi:Protein of unknown function (DUF1360)
MESDALVGVVDVNEQIVGELGVPGLPWHGPPAYAPSGGVALSQPQREEIHMQQAQNRVLTAAREHANAYQDGQERPLGGYATVLAMFASCVAAAAGLAVATGRTLPSGIGPWDVVLLAAGTHKLSRTVSKSAVTSPLRAPFTRYTGTGGPSEVTEEARSTNGPRHSIAELITCPFCLDVWVATGFTIGLVFAPRLTRLVSGAFTALTGADFLHLAYAAAQELQ